MNEKVKKENIPIKEINKEIEVISSIVKAINILDNAESIDRVINFVYDYAQQQAKRI